MRCAEVPDLLDIARESCMIRDRFREMRRTLPDRLHDEGYPKPLTRKEILALPRLTRNCYS